MTDATTMMARSHGSSLKVNGLMRPPWLSKSVWPFDTIELELDGSRIAVTDVGKGPLLVFVHTGFWSFVWREVILRLSADFRCICFDAPGTGQSRRLPVKEITLERAAQTLTALIEKFDLRDIVLVFHDLGGPSGIAGVAPVADRVRGLCAVNTFAWKPSGIPFTGMLAMMGSTPMREFSARSGFLVRATASSFGIGRHLDEMSRQAFCDGVGEQGARAFHSYMHDAHVADALYRRVDRALMGPLHELPLLTIFGERNDPLGFQPQWKKLYPDARQVVVSKGNHFPMCDDPDLVAHSIREFHRECVAS